MAVADAGIIIVSATHNGNTINEPVGYAWDHQVDYVEIPAAGSVGADAQGRIRERLIAEVEYIDAGHMVIETKGSLVLVDKQKDATNETTTITNMVAGGMSKSTGAIPHRHRQQFVNESSMATDPVTFS